MNAVERETAALVAEIRRSNEYNQYQRLRKKISADLRLRERVDSYRRQCFFLQNKEFEEDDIRRIGQLQKDNEDLLDMAVVSEFLTSEMRLCHMVSKVMEQITEAADIGLDL